MDRLRFVTLRSRCGAVFRPVAMPTLFLLTCCLDLAACDRQQSNPFNPTAPTPPTAGRVGTAVVSGTVWLHDAAGMKPFAGATLSAWVETPRVGGGPRGHVVADANGRYSFSVAVGSRLRILQAPPAYQPCDATIEVAGDTTRDIHTVSDVQQLGARLPQTLQSQFPILTGSAFEAAADERRALSNLLVYVDSTGSGGDVLTASTLTDSEGHYVLCGLAGSGSVHLFAWNEGYGLFARTVALEGNHTTFDIQLR
jgi:hypothetical protein